VREVLVRHVDPCSIVLLEAEGPVRVAHVAAGHADFERLAAEYRTRPDRAALIAHALDLAGVLDGTARGRAWSEELGRDPGGIVSALEKALGL
jgi:hypothetical protein